MCDHLKLALEHQSAASASNATVNDLSLDAISFEKSVFDRVAEHKQVLSLIKTIHEKIKAMSASKVEMDKEPHLIDKDGEFNIHVYRELIASKCIDSFDDYNCFFEECDDPQVKVVKLANLNLGTGYLLACDPYVDLTDNYPKFLPKHEINGNQVALELSILKSEVSGEDGRVLAARVRFNDHKAVRFVLALRGNEDVSLLKKSRGEQGWAGFSPESGFICICDAKASEDLKHDQEIPDDFEQRFIYMRDKYILPNVKEHDENFEKVPYGSFKTPLEGYDVHFFYCNYGLHLFYYGLDEQGEICQLMLPFVLMPYK